MQGQIRKKSIKKKKTILLKKRFRKEISAKQKLLNNFLKEDDKKTREANLNKFAQLLSDFSYLEGWKLKNKSLKSVLYLELFKWFSKKKTKRELKLIEKKHRKNMQILRSKLYNKEFFKIFDKLKILLVVLRKKKRLLRKIRKLVYKKAGKKDKKTYYDALKHIKYMKRVRKLAKYMKNEYKDLMAFYKSILLKKKKRKKISFAFMKKNKFKQYKKNLCIFVIKITKSNCFVSMMDLKGKLIKVMSGGMAIKDKKKKIKKAVYIIYKMMPAFKKELKRFRINRAFIYLKTGKEGNHANSLIYMLFKNKVKTNSLFLQSNEPHSAGLRKKKLRRL